MNVTVHSFIIAFIADYGGRIFLINSKFQILLMIRAKNLTQQQFLA